MSRGSFYRLRAKEIRRMAKAADTETARAAFLRLADQYDILARVADALPPRKPKRRK